jgi:hypothetical protein
MQRDAAGGANASPRASAAARVEGTVPGGRPNRDSNRAVDGMQENPLLGLFGSIVSAKNLKLLAEQALRDPNPIMRRLAFSRLLESMTPENAESIRSQLVELGAGGDELRDFQYSWGAIAGKAAFEHASTSSERDLADTLSGWAAANPGEAMAMLDHLPQELHNQRDELTASIVAGLSHRDPAMATEMVLRLGKEQYGRAGNLMEIVARETLRTQGPEAASLWAEKLPDGALKGTAMGQIAQSYVVRDPAAAAEWAGRFANHEFASRAIEQVGGRWAQSDPVAAVNWLEKLPEGAGQKAGLRNAFGDWEDRDPEAAGQYLLAMPKGAQRDSAISGFATGYAWQDPQLSIRWAQDIQDPRLRQESLTWAGQIYYRNNPEAALTWLQTSGLPDEVRQQIMNPRNRR